MLDAWIIDRIQQQERERQRKERPALRLPLRPSVPSPTPQGEQDDSTGKRGSTSISYTV